MTSTVVGTRSTFGSALEGTPPKIVDLPANSANPEIITIPDRAAQIVLLPHADLHFSWGSSNVGATAKAVIDSDDSRGKRLSGADIAIPVAGWASFFYVRSTGGSTATDGLTYFFTGED